MKIRINEGKAKGIVKAPPSKSMAHRLLICAGLSKGTCIVHGIVRSKDVEATMDCLRAVGVKLEEAEGSIRVTGADIKNASAGKILDCGESGSTLRFFVPLCLISGANAVLRGSKRLMERPLGIYKTMC